MYGQCKTTVRAIDCKWRVQVSAKRKETVMTLDTKRQILERIEKGAKPSLLMKEFNCGKATTSDIKKIRSRF